MAPSSAWVVQPVLLAHHPARSDDVYIHNKSI